MPRSAWTIVRRIETHASVATVQRSAIGEVPNATEEILRLGGCEHGRRLVEDQNPSLSG
jgi:hypothetical protein